MSLLNLISLGGGLAFFLYGMNMLGSGLEKVSSGRMEKTLEKLTSNIFLSVLLGAAVTAAIQSSSATIGILQALSVTGALSFSSVYAIIIGVNIGDCVTTAIVCSIGSKADAKRTGLVHIIFNLCASILVIAAVLILHSCGTLDAI